MKKKLLFYLIFLSLFPFILTSGHIHHWDYTVDFSNTGYTTSFSFGFSLENGLSVSDYMKIIFPFALHTSTTISNDFSVYLKLVGQSGCTPIQTTATNIFLSDIADETNSYFIQFLNEKGDINKPLIANTWYIINFQLNNALSVIEGNYPPVQIFTVSSMSYSALIYDYNRVFANIEISPSPSVGSLAFTPVIQSTNQNDIDQIYDVHIDLKPTINITDQARIFVLMQDESWTFNGESCISLPKLRSNLNSDGSVNSTYIDPALNSSQFSCIIGN